MSRKVLVTDEEAHTSILVLRTISVLLLFYSTIIIDKDERFLVLRVNIALCALIPWAEVALVII